MSELIKRLTIDREYIFLGQTDELNHRLKNSKDINYEMLTKKEIKFVANKSWGTITKLEGLGLVDGIKVTASVSDLDADRLKIILRTRVRPEHYFVIALFILCFFVIDIAKESKWLFLYFFAVWIFCHLWFQFIYRLQENQLVDKIVTRLRLLKM